MRTTTVLIILLCFAVNLSSCFVREEHDCSEGDDGCRCYGNDTCNSGLTCVDGTCVGANQEAEDGAADEDSDANGAAMNGDSGNATAPTAGRGGEAVTASDATSGADQTDATDTADAGEGRSDDADIDGTDENPSADSDDIEPDSGDAQEDSGSGGSGGTAGSGGTGGSGGSGTNQFAMYIMLDSSGSMWIPGIDLTIKWQVAVDGINTFIQDPASNGMNIALQYFPSEGGECTGAVYDTPEVPLGRLPDNATAISESLTDTMAFGDGTPTESALLGMTEFCREYENDPVANPTKESCVPVLITDGQPAECNTDAAYLASIVAGIHTDYGIATYVIGMSGADFVWIEEMNRQGGSDCAATNSCQMGGSITLLEALEMIRDSQ